MKKLKFLVEIDVLDGDYLIPGYNIDIKDMIDGDLNQDCKDRYKVNVINIDSQTQEEYDTL